MNDGERAGPVNNFGTSRENREMGQDLEWDNGYEATTHTVLHHHTLRTTLSHTVLHYHTQRTTLSYNFHYIMIHCTLHYDASKLTTSNVLECTAAATLHQW